MTRVALLAAAALALTAGIVALGVTLLVRPPDRAHTDDSDKLRAATTTIDGCLRCHDRALDDPGGVHAARTTGCSPCHLGQPDALSAEVAHRGMEREPGALRTVERTCGRCHAREVERVRTSLMATARGLVAVDRWAFGERPTPDGSDTIADVLAARDPTPAEDHLRRLCAGCHLGTTRDNRDDAITAGASGCSACHAPATPTRAPGAPRTAAHPPVDSQVDDARCLGCHSRSGRIALGYQGLHETAGAGVDACPEADRVTLHDGRSGCRTAPDVHQVAGLACIDCHIHTELMGDGQAHAHEEQATEVRCATCHDDPRAPSTATTWGALAADPITADLLRLRGLPAPTPATPARAGRRGTPLWNVRADPATGAWSLVGKRDGRVHPIRATPADLDHTRDGHERLTCAACHDTTAPRCASCHTTYMTNAGQWDFGLAREAPGRWVEDYDGMGLAPPMLAVTAEDRIAPAMPGMIGTLVLPDGTTRDLRLVAAVAPHTTQRRARTCESCHIDPVVLGVGLDLTATRTGGRALDAAEQRRVLAVGACLACHLATPTPTPAPTPP